MIDLYYWPTPNGWKASIALEELGLSYETHYVNIARGEQHEPAFTAISPNGRIPAIVDRDPADGGPPIPVFETGAILIYLAEKTGRLLPTEPRARKTALEWVMWQMGGLGPMLGQHGHFRLYATEKLPYAIERYSDEANRLYGVLDRRLEGRAFIGDEFSIADIACWPWILTYKAQEIDLGRYPNVRRWYDALKERPGLRRGYELGRDIRKAAFGGTPTDEARKQLFRQKTGAQ